MSRYESACDVCVNACLHGVRHPSVCQVATADWVQIRHCSQCSTWWDTQPASRPAVISRDEAARRVPDADGWTVVGPLLEPRDREGLLVDVQRVDAHQGDLVDLHRQVELPGDATLRDVLTSVLEPFIWNAPRAWWTCRVRSDGQWTPFAEVVTAAGAETLGGRLLVPHALAREFAGGHLLELVCRPR